MSKKSKIKTIALATLLLASSCSTIRTARYKLETKYSPNYSQEFSISETGSFNFKNDYSDEKILLLLHGWGGGIEDFMNPEDPKSQFKIADSIFNGRVLRGEYPSNYSSEHIFESFSDELEAYIQNYEYQTQGIKPEIVIAAHSYGGILGRHLAKEFPEYVTEVAFIGTPHDGLDAGWFQNLISRNYKKNIDEILVSDGKKLNSERHDSIEDLLKKTDFLESFNQNNESLETLYHFYIIKSTNNNSLLIPGPDDSLVSIKSAYPEELLQNGQFETVRFGSIVEFMGKEDHNTALENEEIMSRIFMDLKINNNEQYIIAPKYKDIEKIKF